MMSENWNGISGLEFLKRPYTGKNSEIDCGYDYPYGMHNAMIKDIVDSYNDATGKGYIDIEFEFQVTGITEDVDDIERAYRSLVSDGKNGRAYDNLWWDRFELFEEYVNNFGKLPTSQLVYQGFNLGPWFRHQIDRARAGILDPIRIETISHVYPGKWY